MAEPSQKRENIFTMEKKLKISSWSSSAEEIGGNTDLLVQILLFLPAWSIIRFKVVNRFWRNLMGKDFPLKHVLANPKPLLSGLYYDWEAYLICLQDHSLPKFTFPGCRTLGFKIHASRQGLILYSYGLTVWSFQIIVCNPTTQQYMIFHQRELNLHEQVPKFHFYMDLNPSKSLVFKLILVIDVISRYDVAICASNSSNWKTLHFEARIWWGRLVKHGVLSSDGIVYIMTNTFYLIKFNVETEMLIAVRMTAKPKIPRDWVIGYFGERGDGYLVLIVSPKAGVDFMIYEMDVKESRNWVLKHHIDLALELPEVHRPVLRSDFAVMRVFWNGEKENSDLTFVLGVCGKVISYNKKSGEVKVIRRLPARNSFNWETTYSEVHPFIGSFCPV